jgi:4-amino-4-deoxy-L-arabinose transferase-like glycosyltransferase
MRNGSRLPLSKSSSERATSLRVGLVILLIVGLEAVWLMGWVGWGERTILGGDGPEYHQIAIAILDGLNFSIFQYPPYEPTVWRSPGYPALLALAYLPNNCSLLFVRVLQFAMLALTCWLLYILARHFVSRRAAALSAILAALYGPLVFAPMYHLTETVSALLMVLWVLLLVYVYKNGRRRLLYALAAGVTLGVAALIRPSFLLLVPFMLLLVPLLLWRAPVEERRPLLRALILILCGFALCLAPWTIRNALVAQRFIPLGLGGGVSLYISAQQYSGEVNFRQGLPDQKQAEDRLNERKALAMQLEPDRTGRQARQQAEPHALRETYEGGSCNDLRVDLGVPLTPQQEYTYDRICMKDGVAILRGVSISRLLPSMLIRVPLLWSTADISPWSMGGTGHRIMQLQYGLTMLLLALGLFICRRRLKQHWPLWLVPVYLTLIHMVFHFEGRYSIPGRPFLLIYAGVGLSHLLYVLGLARKDSPEESEERA